jgi:beta-lactamase regulating signal transducer with metallopeptidase domain
MAALLLRASLEGAVAIALVAIVSYVFARNAPAFRCRLWWLACCKLLVGLSGIAPFSIPILPAVASIGAPATVHAAPIAVSPRLTDVPQSAWPFVLLGVWALGAFTACALLARRYIQTRAILRKALPPCDPDVTRLAARLSVAAGLRRVPRVAYSDDVPTPQVAGLLAPTILLPGEQVRTFSRGELAMALCHEIVHVRRRDLGWGWVPAIAARIFFFHPGAMLAAREYALAREEACDAEVLRVMGVAPDHYGRLLVALSADAPKALAPAVGVSSSFRHLRRRLRMLEIPTQTPARHSVRWVVLALLAAAILVPVRLSARTARQHVSASPVADDAYVLFLDENSVTMSGSLDDLAAANAQRESHGTQMLWFRQDGTEYVITDPAVLRSAVAARAGGDARKAHSSRLDDAARAEQLRQAERYAADADRLRRQAELERELSRRQGNVDDATRAEQLRQAERYAADADRERRQAEVERELSRATQAGASGGTQEDLAREMQRAAMEADRRLRALLEESVKSGAARPSGVKGGVEGGVKGGVPGGVKGGVEGGVEGGVPGGVEGGVEGAVDGDDGVDR